MEQVIDFLTRWLNAMFNGIAVVVAGAISLFDWPASAMGVPPELLAAALLCLLLLALWRAMGGYFT